LPCILKMTICYWSWNLIFCYFSFTKLKNCENCVFLLLLFFLPVLINRMSLQILIVIIAQASGFSNPLVDFYIHFCELPIGGLHPWIQSADRQSETILCCLMCSFWGWISWDWTPASVMFWWGKKSCSFLSWIKQVVKGYFNSSLV
jgi:hypothetical protein